MAKLPRHHRPGDDAAQRAAEDARNRAILTGAIGSRVVQELNAVAAGMTQDALAKQSLDRLRAETMARVATITGPGADSAMDQLNDEWRMRRALITEPFLRAESLNPSQRPNVGIIENGPTADGGTPAGGGARGWAGGVMERAELAGKSISLLKSSHDTWRSEQADLAKGQRRFGESLLRTAARSGDLSQAGEIETALSHIPGATRAEGIAAFGAISQQAPRAPLGDRLALATQAAVLAPLAHPSQLGRIAGTLAGTFGTSTSNDDVLDLSIAARERLGAKAGRLTRRLSVETLGTLKRRGYSQEESLALLTSTINEGASAYNLNRAAMGGASLERLQGIARTSATQYAADVEYYEQAQGQDLASQRLMQLGQSRVGRQMLARRNAKVAEERASKEERTAATRLDVTDQMLEAKLNEENVGSIRRLGVRGVLGAARMAAGVLEGMGVSVPDDATLAKGAYWWAGNDTFTAPIQSWEKASQLESEIRSADKSSEIIAAIKDQTAVLRNMGNRPVASAAYAE